MKITGGNVGGLNARVVGGAIWLDGDKRYRACDVRAVQVIDRESKIGLLKAAGNVALGDLVAGTAGAIVGAMVTRPDETLTVVVALWPNDSLVGLASHAEYRDLAGAAAANLGRESPPRELPSAADIAQQQAKVQRGQDNVGALIADLDAQYDRRKRLRKPRRIADLPLALLILAAIIGVGYLCYSIWTALQAPPPMP